MQSIQTSFYYLSYQQMTTTCLRELEIEYQLPYIVSSVIADHQIVCTRLERPQILTNKRQIHHN